MAVDGSSAADVPPTRVAASTCVMVAAMATEQARAVHQACDFLHLPDPRRRPGSGRCAVRGTDRGQLLDLRCHRGNAGQATRPIVQSGPGRAPQARRGLSTRPAATQMWATAVAQLKNVTSTAVRRPDRTRHVTTICPRPFGAPSTSSSPWPSSSPPNPTRAPDSWPNCSETPPPGSARPNTPGPRSGIQSVPIAEGLAPRGVPLAV